MMQDRNQVQEALSQISNEFEAVKGSTASALVDQENALREQKEGKPKPLPLNSAVEARRGSAASKVSNTTAAGNKGSKGGKASDESSARSESDGNKVGHSAVWSKVRQGAIGSSTQLAVQFRDQDKMGQDEVLRLLALYGTDDQCRDEDVPLEEKQAATEAEAVSLEALQEALGMADQKGHNSLEAIRQKEAAAAAKRKARADRKAAREEAKKKEIEAKALEADGDPEAGPMAVPVSPEEGEDEDEEEEEQDPDYAQAQGLVIDASEEGEDTDAAKEAPASAKILTAAKMVRKAATMRRRLGDHFAAYRLDTAAADAETAACVRLRAEIDFAREDLRVVLSDVSLPKLRELIDVVEDMRHAAGAGLLHQAVHTLDLSAKSSLRTEQEQHQFLAALESTKELMGELEADAKLGENKHFREKAVEVEQALHECFQGVSFWRGMERSYCSALMRTKANQMAERAQLKGRKAVREMQEAATMLPAGDLLGPASLLEPVEPPLAPHAMELKALPPDDSEEPPTKDPQAEAKKQRKEATDPVGNQAPEERDEKIPLWQCVERAQASLAMAASGLEIEIAASDLWRVYAEGEWGEEEAAKKCQFASQEAATAMESAAEALLRWETADSCDVAMQELAVVCNGVVASAQAYERLAQIATDHEQKAKDSFLDCGWRIPAEDDGQGGVLQEFAARLKKIAQAGEALALEVQGGWGEAITANPDSVRGGTGTMEVRSLGNMIRWVMDKLVFFWHDEEEQQKQRAKEERRIEREKKKMESKAQREKAKAEAKAAEDVKKARQYDSEEEHKPPQEENTTETPAGKENDEVDALPAAHEAEEEEEEEEELGHEEAHRKIKGNQGWRKQKDRC